MPAFQNLILTTQYIKYEEPKTDAHINWLIPGKHPHFLACTAHGCQWWVLTTLKFHDTSGRHYQNGTFYAPEEMRVLVNITKLCMIKDVDFKFQLLYWMQNHNC